ncbi:YceD family protein [soil metagenome]
MTLTFSGAEIRGHPCAYRDIEVTAPLTGVGTTVARLTPDPVRAALRAESVVEGVLVTGEVASRVTATCARCLKEIPEAMSVEVCELFASPGRGGAEEESSYRLTGEEIHLEQMLRDSCVLALPFTPLCSEGCRGLCASCGRDLNEGACDCTKEDADPRWAPLDALRERLESCDRLGDHGERAVIGSAITENEL